MRTGHLYELGVMALAAGLGYGGAPWWVLIAIATLLSVSTLEEFGSLQPRLMRAGAERVLGGPVYAAGALSIVIAVACYESGHVLRLLATA
jgi:hypothetical protein